MDMDDIAARNDLFPELNPKDLPHMLPPPVCYCITNFAMHHIYIHIFICSPNF